METILASTISVIIGFGCFGLGWVGVAFLFFWIRGDEMIHEREHQPSLVFLLEKPEQAYGSTDASSILRTPSMLGLSSAFRMQSTESIGVLVA